MTFPCEYVNCKHYKPALQYSSCYKCVHNTIPLKSMWRNKDGMTREEHDSLVKALESAKHEKSVKWDEEK